SLVTELAPVILVLRHMQDFPVLILEEPEAHLHPRMQRVLAQVIVRLIRKGLYVWITTHSENFCQQINNFMKIGAVEDREKLRAELQTKFGYSYGEQDYLTQDDIAGYAFINEGDHSVVKELKKHADGLSMPTFNQEMVALSKEVLFLEEHLGDS
ncbi:MAG: AAA family ATPase, partial [Byssovorax sp.]